jgi:general secretion pathway protein A
MYAAHFGLRREPFSIAPDPRFLFLGEMHREALAHLLYGLGEPGGGRAGGFVLLTGEIGAGKTTVCRAFLEQLPPHCVAAVIFNPRLTTLELLQTIADEFRITVTARAGGAPTLKDHVDALNAFLLQLHAQGRQAVLVIDEAQALDPPVLEQLRLLTNLETDQRKLLQIVLIGQPELRDLLARPDLEQLAQRVIARCHLPALTAEETAQYVRHRLAVAGGPGAVAPDGAAAPPLAPPQMPFDDAALAAVHRASRGIPRRINLLCDRALLGAYAHHRAAVGRREVLRAADEVFGTGPSRVLGLVRGLGMPVYGAAAAGLAVMLLAGALALGVGRDAGDVGAAGDAGDAGDAGAAAGAGDAVQAAGATRGGPAAAGARTSSTPAPGAADAIASVVVAPGAAAAVVGPAPDGPDAAAALEALLAQAPRDEEPAWRALAARWGLAWAEGVEPCAAARAGGMACFRGQGGLPLVRQLDRPGLVRLRSAAVPDGAWVQVTALAGERLTLQAGTQRLTLPVAALAGAWRGDFATLWRVPPGWSPQQPPGAAGPELRGWLARHLPAAGTAVDPGTVTAPPAPDAPAPEPAAPPPGPRALAERVRAFQLVQGLPPDGLAGPVTLMRLNARAGVAEPRLEAPA